MTRVLWMRHGESTWNVAGREQGRTPHPPLTDLGRRQVQRAAHALADRGVTTVVSSPLVRARQSADLVADVLGLAVVEDPRLVERATDETVEDLLERVAGFLRDDVADGTLVVTHGDVIAYVTAALGRVTPALPANAEVRETVL